MTGVVFVLQGPFIDEEDAVLYQRAIAVISGEAPFDYASHIESIGDINADGFGDFLIGAPGNDDGASEGGGIFLFTGPLEGHYLTSDATIEILGTTEEENLGLQYDVNTRPKTFERTGDVNQDGYDDMLISSPFSQPFGSVHLIYGGE